MGASSTVGSVLTSPPVVLPRFLTLLRKPPLEGMCGLFRVAAGGFAVVASVTSVSSLVLVLDLNEPKELVRGLVNLDLKPPLGLEAGLSESEDSSSTFFSLATSVSGVSVCWGLKRLPPIGGLLLNRLPGLEVV